MIAQSDLLIYTALKVGLNDLRKNKFLLDEAYANITTDPYLKDLYGQKEVENFKAFVDKKIFIFTEHRPPGKASFPCIVIKVGGGQEDAPKDALGDSYQQDIVDPSTLGGVFQSPQILLGPVTPIEYDQLTGQVTFDSNVNLETSHVFEGQYVYDEVNQKAYQIQLVIDSSNLLLESNLSPPPNLTGLTIRTSQNAVGHTLRSIWVWENHTISVFATQVHEILYLWTLVMYMLLRYKKQLWDARNFAITTMSYSEIYRASAPDDPNNLYGRDISIRGRVEHSVIETTTPLIEGIIPDIKIDGMKSPDAVLPEARLRGWEGEFDDDNS